MKTTTTVTCFTLLIGFIWAMDTIEMIRPATQECCKIGFKDEASQAKCLTSIEKQLQDTCIVNTLTGLYADNITEAKDKRKKDLCNKVENLKILNALSDPKAITRTMEEIYKNNENDIKEAEEAEIKQQVDEMCRKMKDDCQAIVEAIEQTKDPDFFTTEIFGFIVASGIVQFDKETWSPLVNYLKDNKDDAKTLETVGAGLWQIMYCSNNDLISFITTCQCKDKLFTIEFRNFFEWIYRQRKLYPRFPLCTLEKYLTIFNENKDIINDPEKNRYMITKNMWDCYIPN